MSVNKVVLFGEKAAGVYRMSDIYFPDSDGSTTPEQSGKIVPAVGSLVVDDTTGLHNQQYTVTAIDPETYYPTLVPSSFSYDTSSTPDRVLNYGNDLLMLYFQKTTITAEGQTLRVTRLIVDNKLSLFGNHAATYQLLRYNDSGALETISKWYRPNGMAAGTAIPMLETGVSGIRKCDGCYTDVDLTEGDSIVCRIYSAGGVQISELTLIAKEAHMLNERASVANPIVGMSVKANQMLETDVLFLYTGQNPSELAIFPHLLYSDGQYVTVAIDGMKGFVYGLESIKTSIPGMEYRLLIKYYIDDNDVAVDTNSSRYAYYRTTDTVWNDNKEYYKVSIVGSGWEYSLVPKSSYTVGESISSTTEYFERAEIPISVDSTTNIRFLTKEVVVRVVSLDTVKVSKISLIPIWSANDLKYKFMFLRYMESMDESPKPKSVSTESASYLQFGIDGESPNGSTFDAMQSATIVYKNIVGSSYVTAKQKVYFELHNQNTVQDGINYLISDTVDATKQYGSGSNGHTRPVIYYRATSVDDADTGKTGYFIPSSVFGGTSTQSASEMFVDNFYYQANPPRDPKTQETITPTHFVVKDLNGAIISRYNNGPITTIPVEEFSSQLYLKMGSNSANYHVGKCLIVEFLKETESSEYQYIYGVPVDVVAG